MSAELKRYSKKLLLPYNNEPVLYINVNHRIEEIRYCCKVGLWQAALSLTLTLPDICGDRNKYPNSKARKRWMEWLDNSGALDEFTFLVNKDENSDLLEVCKIMTIEAVYSLRCSFLHQGNADLEKEKVPKEIKRIKDSNPYVVVNFAVKPTSNALFLSYGSSIDTKRNIETIDYSINVPVFCNLICDYAERYIHNHKEVLKNDFELRG